MGVAVFVEDIMEGSITTVIITRLKLLLLMIQTNSTTWVATFNRTTICHKLKGMEALNHKRKVMEALNHKLKGMEALNHKLKDMEALHQMLHHQHTEAPHHQLKDTEALHQMLLHHTQPVTKADALILNWDQHISLRYSAT